MRVTPTSLPDGYTPAWKLDLYRDPNGNWFAAVERPDRDGTSFVNTATFDDPREAVAEAVRRLPPRS